MVDAGGLLSALLLLGACGVRTWGKLLVFLLFVGMVSLFVSCNDLAL